MKCKKLEKEDINPEASCKYFWLSNEKYYTGESGGNKCKHCMWSKK